MQILKVDHTDFTLVIECNNLESTFNKASKRQLQILNATSYSVNEGDISIYNFESRTLEKLIDSKTYPLIFENKDYFIGITFKDKAVIKSPFIKLKVEEKFFYREELGFSGNNKLNDLAKPSGNKIYKRCLLET